MNQIKKRYTIQNDALDFHTGLNNTKNQIILGVLYPDYVAVEFDSLGKYLNVISKPVTPNAFSIVDGIYFEKDDLVDDGLVLFKEQLGFTPSTIIISKFWLDDRHLGIEDVPEYMSDTDEDADEDKLLENQRLLEEWIDSKHFVLWWGKDYWMSVDGEVESS